MKIVLATGIYPPEIGGPATYVHALAEEMVRKGIEVSVITYGEVREYGGKEAQKWPVMYVAKSLPIIRWLKYASALKQHAADADAVIAFSSISAGVPLLFAHLKKPKKILRLGGDFFWERYTARVASRQADCGGMKGLRAWYESKTTMRQAANWIMNALLRKFDHIVFSTEFQKKIYEENYWGLESTSVIENALPSGSPRKHERHEPFWLLFMGRFVGFKNLPALVQAVGALRATPLRGQCMLTFVGDGPMKSRLQCFAKELNIEDVITFINPVHGEEKQKIFREHDLLLLPSITEISPNVALEARAAGLPVLLTQETGLSRNLIEGMEVRDLLTSEGIRAAIEEVMRDYGRIATEASLPLQKRDWNVVAGEWIPLLSSGI